MWAINPHQPLLHFAAGLFMALLNPSVGQALVAIACMALITHQIFRYLETYSIVTHVLLILVPNLIGVELLWNKFAPISTIAIALSVFCLTTLFSITFYRLSPFHPLAKYPGPLVCRLSKFWLASIAYSGRQHLYIKSLHEQYGDVVRIGPNELSFRDPSLENAMLGTPGVPKGPLFIGRLLTATNLPLVAIMDPVAHQERRKAWNRAFSAAALKEYEPLIANRAAQLVRVLERQRGATDIARFMNYFAYDFMCDMAYGGGSELLRDGDMNDVWHTMESGWPVATILGCVPWLGPYVGMLPLVSSAQLLSFARQFTMKRIRHGSLQKDIFHYLSNEDQPDKGTPPITQLIDDGVLAIVAGADTTSSALTSLMFCLASHPEALKRLQAEVDRFYPHGENPVDPRHHRNMHYLNAVINEALRLYPPTPSGTQRQVPHHSGGAVVGSYFVPAGTAIFLHPYSLHRDPRNFSPMTTDFWPERWLIADGLMPLAGAGAQVSDAPAVDGGAFVHNAAAFLPFSYGPMNCVGKQLAMQEMRTVVCAVVQKFELELRKGWDVREYDAGFKDFFVTTRPAVPMILRARGQ
ncbi:high nitrogen upregulated cytochrome P450 monooxygenase 2 [Trametes elegans]|nr:high nitrogen upregulated cytochrome P450 monooxygenase 2 [Trametes elegans]